MGRLITPLAKATGLGSSREGTHDFWQQRLTAVALVPLTLWLCFSLANLPQTDYASAIQWLQSPINSILLILFVVTGFHHGQLGMKVIIEDYVFSEPIKISFFMFIRLFSLLCSTVSVFAIIYIALGASA